VIQNFKEYSRERGTNETGKLRDEMLKNLALASDGYNELYNHLNEGIKVKTFFFL
jgi:hypothetical protein